jgi:hypothetical protein
MAAKKMPAKKVAAKKSAGPVNPIISEIKKAIEKEGGFPRSKGKSRKEYVQSVQDEGYAGEVKVGNKYFSGTSNLVQLAYKEVAGKKWDSMNNYYKATGTKPKKMSAEQNKQFQAERAYTGKSGSATKKKPKK